jgi:phage RecT family recombinase
MTQTLDAPQNQQQLPARRDGNTGGSDQVVAKRSFDPFASVGSAGSLKGLLETQRKAIAEMLPKHITPERLIKTMLVAVNRNPQILQCTQASVLETVNRAAELGLDLSGTLGEAYPVPFNNKVKTDRGEQWLMQLQMIIGYRGLEKLAWQSGAVESIDSEVVCINDHFVFKKGTEVVVEWSPKLDGDRGKAIGAYACIKLKGGGKLARFLTVADIEKIRSKSKSKDSPAWRDWWDEMARAKTLKRTLKDAPLSTEKLTKALEYDNADTDLADVVIAETHRNGGAAGLVDQLKGRDPKTEIGRLLDAPEPPTGTNVGTGELDESQIGGSDSNALPENPNTDTQLTAQDQWDRFLNQTYNLIGDQMDRPTFDKAVGAFVVGKLKKKQQPHELGEADRQELVKQVKERLFAFAPSEDE